MSSVHKMRSVTRRVQLVKLARPTRHSEMSSLPMAVLIHVTPQKLVQLHAAPSVKLQARQLSLACAQPTPTACKTQSVSSRKEQVLAKIAPMASSAPRTPLVAASILVSLLLVSFHVLPRACRPVQRLSLANAPTIWLQNAHQMTRVPRELA